MLIAVDFDGTIVHDCFPGKPKPQDLLPGAREVLTELHRRGHHLVLWTLRDPGVSVLVEPAMTAAIEFLTEQGMPFFKRPRDIFGHPLCWKIPVDLFIEDKIPGGFPGWEFVGKKLFGEEWKA